MSGGDFVSKSEGSICAQRGIEDRVQVAKDLNAVVKRHGVQGAALQLDIMPGHIDQVVARKTVITPGLLTSLYGPKGRKLRPGLSSIDGEGSAADVAKVMAAMNRRAPAAVPVPAPPTKREAIAAMHAEAAPLPSLKRVQVLSFDNEPAALAAHGVSRFVMAAWLQAVRESAGTWYKASLLLDMGQSTIMDLAAARKPFTPKNLAHLVPLRARWLAERDEARAVGEADAAALHVEEQNAAVVTQDATVDRGAAALGVLAAPLPDTNSSLAEAVRVIAQAGEASQAGGSHRSPPVAEVSDAVTGPPPGRTTAASEGEAGVGPQLPPPPPSTIVGGDAAGAVTGDHAVLPPAVVGVDIVLPIADADPIAVARDVLKAEAEQLAAEFTAIDARLDALFEEQQVAKARVAVIDARRHRITAAVIALTQLTEASA